MCWQDIIRFLFRNIIDQNGQYPIMTPFRQKNDFLVKYVAENPEINIKWL